MKRICFLLMFIVLICTVSATDDLLALQGKVDQSGVLVDSGDIVVEIWDAATAGNLVYNSTSDFNSAIQGGFFDIVIGSGTNSLTLNLSQIYYMDIAIEGQDIDWGADERRQFQSTVGRPYFEEEVILNDTLYTKDDKVGINDNSPSHTLSVNGNLSLDSTVYASCTALETDSDGGLVCGTDAGQGSGVFPGWDPSLVWHNQSLNSTIDLRLEGLDWGNITTNIPAFALNDQLVYINDSTLNDTYYSILDNSSLDTRYLTVEHNDSIITNASGIDCSIITGTPDTDFCTDSTGNAATFWAGSAVNEVYNDTTAGVGIGTNNPSYKLEVNGDANLSGFLYADSTGVGIGTSTPSQALEVGGNINISKDDAAIFLSDTNSKEWSLVSIGNRFEIHSSGISGDVLTIDGGGDVGIGIQNAADYGLEVNDDTNLSGMLYTNSSRVGIGADSPDSTLTVSGGFNLSNSSDEGIYYDSTNNIVGIGTSTPSISGIGLEVAATGTGAQFFANRTDGALVEMSATSTQGVVGTRTNSPLALRTNLLPAITIDESQQVGIGTTSPAYKLEVNSVDTAMNISSMLYVNDTSVGIGTSVPGYLLHLSRTGENSAIVLERTDGAEGYINAATTSVNVGSITAYPLRLITNSVARSVIGANGGLGVGTTDPQYAFEVNNNTAAMNVSGMLYVNDTSVGIGTDSPGTGGGLHVSSSSFYPFYLESTGGSGVGLRLYESGTLYWNIFTSAGTGLLTFHNGTDSAMTLEAEGNLGIGTASPTSRLQVINDSASQNFGSPTVTIGYDGGAGISEGNLKIGNYEIYVSGSEAATYDDATEGLVIQTENNPTATGFYQLLSVQSSGDANRFSVIHGATGYASQFYDSLMVGSGGYTTCASAGVGSVDCGTGTGSDLYVKDDVEVDGDIYVGTGTVTYNGSCLILNSMIFACDS